MSRFYFHLSRGGLAIQLFGFWILLGRFGNVHNPCIHIEFPFNSGWRGRLFRIAYRTSIGTESTIHIRYGRRASTTGPSSPTGAGASSGFRPLHPTGSFASPTSTHCIAQYKMLWEDEHGCEVETRLLGVKNRHMFL